MKISCKPDKIEGHFKILKENNLMFLPRNLYSEKVSLKMKQQLAFLGEAKTHRIHCQHTFSTKNVRNVLQAKIM